MGHFGVYVGRMKKTEGKAIVFHAFLN